MAEQESIDFNTKDTLRGSKLLEVHMPECVWSVGILQSWLTVSQTSYSTMKPSGSKEPVSLSKLFCTSLAFKFHVNSAW